MSNEYLREVLKNKLEHILSRINHSIFSGLMKGYFFCYLFLNG
jgi:hypothetical protein